MIKRSEVLKKELSLFNKINNELSAYFLGYLYADGSIYKTQVCLILNNKDSFIVEKLADILCKRSSVRYRSNYVILAIKSKHLSNCLKQLGCIEKKSLILKYPTNTQVPKKVIHHFIRGYFDGDGCAMIKNNQLVCEILGTNEFLTGIRNELKNNNIRSTIYKYNYRKVDLLRICTTDNMMFKEYLYNKSNIYLQRKLDKFLIREKYLSLYGRKRRE